MCFAQRGCIACALHVGVCSVGIPFLLLYVATLCGGGVMCVCVRLCALSALSALRVLGLRVLRVLGELGVLGVSVLMCSAY